tara:strand:+ start:323 stop:610 length:288 start_codon:yes stop_codon:yes gene_type:complete
LSILVNKFPLSFNGKKIPVETTINYIKTSEGYDPYYGRIIYDIVCKVLNDDLVISCSKDLGSNMNMIQVNNIDSENKLLTLYWKDVFDEKFPLIV